jgi:hypothetical protein
MIEQHAPHDLNVTRQDTLDERSPSSRDRHVDAALVFD